MKIVIDNNIILDVFQNRKPFVEYSSKVLRLVETNHVKGYITANSITDIYYILNRSIHDKEQAYNYMNTLLELIEIIDVTARDIKKALHPGVIDFYDELISVCANNYNIDYIITRNTSDFRNSPVLTLTPEDFINRFFENI
jgi:predicted nucleic acid-binding protein